MVDMRLISRPTRPLAHAALTTLAKFDPQSFGAGLAAGRWPNLWWTSSCLTAAHSAAPEYSVEQNDWYHAALLRCVHQCANYLFGTLQPSQ